MLLSEEAFDLLHNLLLLQPEKRITAVDALRHPWFVILIGAIMISNLPNYFSCFRFDGLRDEEDVESQVGIFNGDDIEAVSTREELRGMLYLFFVPLYPSKLHFHMYRSPSCLYP